MLKISIIMPDLSVTLILSNFSKFLNIPNATVASNKISLNEEADDVELSIIIPVFGKLDFMVRH